MTHMGKWDGAENVLLINTCEQLIVLNPRQWKLKPSYLFMTDDIFLLAEHPCNIQTIAGYIYKVISNYLLHITVGQTVIVVW